MPHILFYESGAAPSTRSVRQLLALRNAGWEVTVAHWPAQREAVNELGFRSVELPVAERNIFWRRLRADEEALSSHLSFLKSRPDATAKLSERAAKLERRVARFLPKQALNDRLQELNTQIRSAAGRQSPTPAQRAALLAMKVQRKLFAKRLNVMAAMNATRLETARAEQAALAEKRRAIGSAADAESVAARLGAVRAALQIKTPLTAGGTFGISPASRFGGRMRLRPWLRSRRT